MTVCEDCLHIVSNMQENKVEHRLCYTINTLFV